MGLFDKLFGKKSLRKVKPAEEKRNPYDEEQVFTEEDNVGTRLDTEDKAFAYWMTRNVQQKFDPFVLYIFDHEADARNALMELDCIHVAVDTGNLICTETLIFGYYPTEDGAYEAIVWGQDLTDVLWTKAKESFEKHGGCRKNDQEPERRAISKATGVQKPDELAFDREYSEQGMGGLATYRIYKAPNATSAKAFLKENPVNKPLYYFIVETLEGNYGRDIDGIYKE